MKHNNLLHNNLTHNKIIIMNFKTLRKLAQQFKSQKKSIKSQITITRFPEKYKIKWALLNMMCRRKKKMLLNLGLTNLRMEQYMQDNGKMDRDMEMENNYRLMDLYMKAIGKIILQMEKVDRFMPMAVYMKALGQTIKLMVKGSINI